MTSLPIALWFISDRFRQWSWLQSRTPIQFGLVVAVMLLSETGPLNDPPRFLAFRFAAAALAVELAAFLTAPRRPATPRP